MMVIFIYKPYRSTALKSISPKNMAKIADFQPKIGLDTTFASTLNGHNSAIFYPILTSDHTKMISLSRQMECC